MSEERNAVNAVGSAPAALRASSAVASMYFDVRDRFVGAVSLLGDDAPDRVVPACPEWTIRGLLAHVVAMPMAIAAGEIPDEVMGGGDPNPWLGRLVAQNQDRPVAELAKWWGSNDDALAALLPGAGLLLADLFTHEGDLHGALGSRAHRATPELDSQIDAAMAGLQHDIDAAGLPPVGVDTGTDRRLSGAGEPGWIVHTDHWTAHRVFNSRRTREEMVSLPHEGDPERYFTVMHRHLPLPDRPLGEV